MGGLNKVVLKISMLQEGGEGECRMSKAHLPAVWDVWLPDKEHWLLLSPDLGVQWQKSVLPVTL